jgi:magnesium transporter
MPWYQIADPNSSELDRLAQEYHLHPLHVEDCRSHNQRVKLDEGADYLFLVLRPVIYENNGNMQLPSFNIFLGKDYCITVNGESCHVAQEAIRSAERLAPPDQPDQIVYRLFDAVVDGYLPVLDCIDDDLDELEDKVLDNPSPAALQQIFALKRALISLRRVLANTRDVGMSLQRYEGALISPKLAPFFRDIYDHLARNLDSAETQRDLLNGTLDVYLSSMANRTNNVMKVLTVVSTISLPAVVITGFYGMNVKGIPFSDSSLGGIIVAGLITASTLGLLVLFRKLGWF